MADWYCNYGNGTSTGYFAVAQFAVLTPYSVGNIIRQLAAPTLGNERCFRCTTLGTTGASESAWNLTKGATTTQGTAVFTEVTGNSTYNWSAPFARIQTPMSSTSWMAAGDRLFVGSNHAETQSSAMTFNSSNNSTAALPTKIICVNVAGSVPPVSADLRTTATVTTTGASSINLNSINTWQYIYGIIFTAGTSGTAVVGLHASGNGGYLKLEACSIGSGASVTTGAVSFTGGNIDAAAIELLNTTMAFTAAGHNISLGNNATFLWRNTASAITGTVPTTLFSGTGFGTAILDGVDLSAAGSGKTLVGATSSGAASLVVRFLNCKFGASVTIGGAPTNLGSTIDTMISDSSGTAYNTGRIQFAGTKTTDITNYRTGGASDGTTSYSWSIATNSSANSIGFFECFQLAVWNATTGSTVNATVEIINDGTTLTSADIWVEFEVLDTSGTPLATLHTTGVADPLAAGVNLTTSSATWTTSGISSAVKQYMTASFTPRIAGYVRGTVKIAKASKTIWVDPEITLS